MMSVDVLRTTRVHHPTLSPLVTMVPLHPTPDHGRVSFSLRPGVIDDEALEFFQWGYCHLLACAIHEITGWPFAAVEGISGRTGQWVWTHMGVLTPVGDFLDITGVHPVDCLRPAYVPSPMRVRSLAGFPEFCQTVGLAEDTPLSWWTGEFPGIGTQTIRAFATGLLDTLPTAHPREAA